MLTPEGSEPLTYRRIDRSRLDVIRSVELEPVQAEQFLGSLDDIEDAVRRGLAYSVFSIDASGQMVGFYVLHPDRRDSSCWWLGWLALDRRQQGRGHGRRAMGHIMRSLHRISGCHRARLLVDPANTAALRLYRDEGFREVGIHGTGEIILEVILSSFFVLSALSGRITTTLMPKRNRRKGRVRLSHGPHAAMVICVERGPPCLSA